MTTILYGYAAINILVLAFFAKRGLIRMRAEREAEPSNVIPFHHS